MITKKQFKKMIKSERALREECKSLEEISRNECNIMMDRIYDWFKSAIEGVEIDDNVKIKCVYDRPNGKINTLSVHAAFDQGPVGCNKNILTVTSGYNNFGRGSYWKWYCVDGFWFSGDTQFDKCIEHVTNKIARFDFDKGK